MFPRLLRTLLNQDKETEQKRIQGQAFLRIQEYGMTEIDDPSIKLLYPIILKTILKKNSISIIKYFRNPENNVSMLEYTKSSTRYPFFAEIRTELQPWEENFIEENRDRFAPNCFCITTNPDKDASPPIYLYRHDVEQSSGETKIDYYAVRLMEEN